MKNLKFMVRTSPMANSELIYVHDAGFVADFYMHFIQVIHNDVEIYLL